MRHLVKEKQPSSRMCLVCGMRNPYGLCAAFYALDNDECVAVFRPRNEHQGYPGRLHGGIAAAILDETIGRAIMIKYTNDTWGVAIELTTRYRKPIPLDQELRVIGRITKDTSRIFEGTGEILLEDGTVAVEGRGKYMKFPLAKITDLDFASDWRVIPSEEDPDEIEI